MMASGGAAGQSNDGETLRLKPPFSMVEEGTIGAPVEDDEGALHRMLVSQSSGGCLNVANVARGSD